MKQEDIKKIKLQEIIVELADEVAISSEKDIKKYLERLNKIYIEDNQIVYRHMYSDLFGTLLDLKKKNIMIDSIGENLLTIYNSCEENELLSNPLKKLMDHTNLEIARINYVNNIDTRLGSNWKNLQNDYTDFSASIRDLKPKVTDLEKRTEKTYSEFISILGIFSAIVLVYFGGTSILGNILSNIQDTFLLKSIAISTIVGIIVLNTIFMFFYFLAKLTNGNIARVTKELPYDSFIKKLKIKYPIIFYLNFFLLILLIFDGILWIIYILNKQFDLFGIIILFFQNINNKHLITFAMFLLLLLVDISFLLFYIYGKLFDRKNINKIAMFSLEEITLFRSQGKWYFRNQTGYKILLFQFSSIKYFFKSKYNNMIYRIINLKRCLFNCYPNITWFNIIMLIIIFIYIRFF